MSRPWLLLLLSGVALAGGRLVLPGLPWPVLIVGFVGVCATAIGAAVRGGLQPRIAWSAFAVSVFVGGLTNGLWAGGDPLLPRDLMDILDLVAYATGAVGVVTLLRAVGGADPDAWLDASAAGIVVGMLVWEFLVIGPEPGGSTIDAFSSTLVAVFDTIVFVGIARFILRPLGGHGITAMITIIGIILAIDASYYAAGRQPLSDQTYEAMWIAGYAAWSALALHPQSAAIVSRRRVGSPVTVRTETIRSIRGIFLLGAALLVGPVLLWWHTETGARSSTPTLLLGSILLAIVVIARLTRLVLRLVSETRALREARAAAEERERFVSALVDQSPVGIEVFDAGGQSLRMNEAKQGLLAHLYASMPEGARATSVRTDDFLRETGHGPAIDRAFAGEIVALEPRRIPLSALGGRDDVWIRQTYYPVSEPGGGLAAVISFTEDVTATERAEERRRAMEGRLRETAKLEALGVLAGGIAHDFNNLLVAIMGHASFARAGLDAGSPATADLAAVEVAAQRAADLAQQMLAYSGRGSFVVAPIRVEDVIAEMGDLLARSVGKNVMLARSFAPDLPPVLADATQLRQVVLNLIINASDAIGGTPGTVTLRTALAEVAADDPDLVPGTVVQPGTHVLIEVADTGVGMDSETLARIFDPFFTTKQRGRGLGLAAAIGIVKGHGGAIRVHSSPGAGTRFQVLLPPHRAPEPTHAPLGAPPGGAAPGLRPPEGALAGAEPSAGRILVVDDEESIRVLAQRVLERAGFLVVTVGDGPDAIAAVAAAPEAFDGVLLDLTLPTLDGVTVLEEIRRIRPSISVVLSSGWAADEVAGRLGTAPKVTFLQKPYGAGALVAAFVRRD